MHQNCVCKQFLITIKLCAEDKLSKNIIVGLHFGTVALIHMSSEYTFVCDTFEVGFGFGVSVLHGWQRWLFTRAVQKYGKQTTGKETPKSFCVNGIISFQHAQSE